MTSRAAPEPIHAMLAEWSAASEQAIANVYVHAPFCQRRCCYCDFAVTVNRNPDATRWLDAIRTELETLRRGGEVSLAEELKTLYVGGGTPSLLDPASLAGLVRCFGRRPLDEARFEWTAEANPESFTADVARTWAAAGVNRISFGLQSFSDRALKWMGRLHAASAGEQAVDRARNAGVENLSIDLIFGLPRTVSRDWKKDLERALELDVPHIALYGLTVEPGTPLDRFVRTGRTSVAGERRYRDEYLCAAEVLVGAGYEHYEVSNFARPGFASRHNRAYWQGVPYLGLGNGAHSYYRGSRWWNDRDWAQYANRIAQNGSARAGGERLSREQRRLEALWLALRTAKGVDLAAEGTRASRIQATWRSRGLAVWANGRLRLTPAGWLLLDDLAVELDAALADEAADG